MAVPFADLYAQYLSLKDEIDTAIADVIAQSAFVRGPYVEKFEEEFAAAIGQDYCVSCANGTDAIYIAMHALGVRSGDEVITTAHSWISTSETITQAGGRVIFCDTDASTYTISPEAIEAKITDRTVGIIPVHLYGQPADMGAIMSIAERHGLWVIEDCAQAHLAEYDGKKIGGFGDAATFSFYPGKNLGAMGDAGAILTGDRDLRDKMSMFARHGGLKKGDHRIEGVNSRLDGLQAAILSVKLPHLASWTRRRQQVAAAYDEAFAGLSGITIPVVGALRSHVYHLYVVQHARRDELAKFLKARNIGTVVNYPVALPFLPAYDRLGHGVEDFPNAHSNQSRILSLPIFGEMSDAHIQEVIEAVQAFCDAEA